MRITDSQVHLWAANTPERPWLEGIHPHKATPLGPDDMLAEMDAAGVDRVVIVPPLWEAGRNDLAIAAAAAHPQRFAVMGRLDLMAPASRQKIAKWCDQPGMLGLRFAFNTPDLFAQLKKGEVEWIWRAAENAEVPIFVYVPHPLVPVIDEVARRYPQLKLALDHMAIPSGQKDDKAFRELDKLLAIAKHPNVAVKVSALPCYSNEAYPYRSLHGYIRQAYDAFGPQRLFWGTDFSRSPVPYKQHVTLFTEEMPWLSDQDKEWIMSRSVCEWLGWN